METEGGDDSMTSLVKRMEPAPAEEQPRRPYRISQRYFFDKMQTHQAERDVGKAAKAGRRYETLRLGTPASIRHEVAIYVARGSQLTFDINLNNIRYNLAEHYADVWKTLARKLAKTGGGHVDKRAMKATLMELAGNGFRRGEYMPTFLLQTYRNNHDNLESFARWRLLEHHFMRVPYDTTVDVSVQGDEEQINSDHLLMMQIRAAALTKRSVGMFDLKANRQKMANLEAQQAIEHTHKRDVKLWKCRTKERAVLHQDVQAAQALSQYYTNTIIRRTANDHRLREHRSLVGEKEAAWRARLTGTIDETEKTDSDDDKQSESKSDDEDLW